jgi:formate-dependent phosphoribosylglycinamide formyltransferase (GAR transformylase)
MRERFLAAGLPTPRFVSAGIDEDPTPIAASIAYPAVIKPLDLSASQGVIKVNDATEFPSVFKRVAAIASSCARNGAAPRLLIEDFIPGTEVAVEALLRGDELEVLAIFDKPDPLAGPFFEETIYVTPSRLAPELQREIVQTTEHATRALGLSEGPIHAELRLNDHGVWILEVAARSIGGLCSRTLRFAALPPADEADAPDFSLEELILRHAAGLPMPAHTREREAAGVMMLPIATAGTLRKVDGQELARSTAGIGGLVITIPPGEKLVPLPEGDRYLGFMFARGKNPAAVEASLREAHAKLKVRVDG